MSIVTLGSVSLTTCPGQPLRLAQTFTDADPETQRRRELVGRVQAGDVDAFGELYRLYRPVVRSYLAARVPDPQQLDDLVAEVFCRALAGIGRFTWHRRDIGAWLVTIAHARLVDSYRHGRTRREVPVGDVGLLDRTSAATEVETAVLAKLTRQAVHEALSRLSPDHRQVVILRFLRERSVAEAAEAMQRSPEALQMLQHRALLALAAVLPAAVAS